MTTDPPDPAMIDPQNSPLTCPYRDQPRQDTFENRYRFECGTSLLASNHKTVKQGRECKLRVAYSKLLVDYCNLKNGPPSVIAAWEQHAIEHPLAAEWGAFKAGYEARDKSECEWTQREDNLGYQTACRQYKRLAIRTLPFCSRCGRRWRIKERSTNNENE